MKYLKICPLVALTMVVSMLSCSDDGSNSGGSDTGEMKIENAIIFDDCSPEEDLVLENHSEGVDYIFDCFFWVKNGGLFIEPGTTIYFTTGSVLLIDNGGFISALGTQSEPITFSSESKIQGSYEGIRIESSDLRNQMNYCRIDYAGDLSFDTGLKTAVHVSGKLAMNNCSITNSSSHGVYFSRRAEIKSFEDNKILNTKDASVSCILSQIGEISGTNVFDSSETFDGVEIRELVTFGRPAIIDGLKVFLKNSGFVRSPLTINAGSELVMNAGTGITVNGSTGEGAKLNALGTSSNPIIIRGREQSNGYWKGILFDENTNDNLMAHVSISDGGGGKILSYASGQNGIANIVVGDGFLLGGTSLTMNNCTVSNSAGCGVFVASKATLVSNNLDFLNNDTGNICNE